MPDEGAMNNVPKIKRIARLPKHPRFYVRYKDISIGRDHRGRSVEFGDPPLEQRAIPRGMFPGATLPERITFKKLAEIIGTEGFIFQRSEQGGRNFLGGYVIDFVIIARVPHIALEVLGDYWHQSATFYADQDRAMALERLGYVYEEVWEHEIYQSDQALEDKLLQIIGRAV